MITQKIDDQKAKKIDEVLQVVFEALNEKGYNAIGQIWDYLLTDDPHYITSYKNARNLLQELDREEIGRYLLQRYFKG